MTSGALGPVLSYDQVKPKATTLVFTPSLINTPLLGTRVNRGRDSMVFGLQSPVQSVHITRLNPDDGDEYSTQHYVIKLVNDFRQVSGFPCIVRFPTPMKLIDTI
jgi:hypothetical protein